MNKSCWKIQIIDRIENIKLTMDHSFHNPGKLFEKVMISILSKSPSVLVGSMSF